MPGIHTDTSGGNALATFHSLHLTWSQWTSVLTENIISKNLKVHIIFYNFSSSLSVSRKINKYFQEVHIVNKSDEKSGDQDLKIPYQIFGESLASVTVITLRGFKVSSQQVQ